MAPKGGKSPQTIRDVARVNEQNVWKLRAEFKTQEEIATILGLDQSSVSKILKRLNERAMVELPREIAGVKMQQASQLEFIAVEAMRAWELSKQVAKKSHTSTRQQGKSSHGKMEIKGIEITNREGNPAYLATAMKAMSDIRDIFGLNAPKKFDIALAIMERFMEVARETGIDPESAINDYIEVLVVEHQRLGAGGSPQDPDGDNEE